MGRRTRLQNAILANDPKSYLILKLECRTYYDTRTSKLIRLPKVLELYKKHDNILILRKKTGQNVTKEVVLSAFLKQVLLFPEQVDKLIDIVKKWD